MSGFEVIGVVLAVWPLVINGLQAYKIARNIQGWDLLYDQFKTEEIIYIDCISHLLASDIPEADLSQLTSRERPNEHLLKDAALNRALENRLGPLKSGVVVRTLYDMNVLLSALGQKIERHKIPRDTSYQRVRNSIFNLRMFQGKIKDDLEQLKGYNVRLQRLLFSPSANSSYRDSTKKPKPSNLPPEVLRRITLQANEVHDAIYEAYNCPCRTPHQANLRTLSAEDSDLQEPFELVFPVSETRAREIAVQDPSSPGSNSDGNETPSDIVRRWSHRGSLDTLPSSLMSPSSTSSPFRSRSLSICQFGGVEDGGLIEDLCQFIRRLAEPPQAAATASCLGILGLKKKKYTLKVTSLDGDSAEPNLICLDEYLSPEHKGEVSYRKRMDLALSLSLAILQFYSTPWIDMRWTWKDFCVLEGDSSQIFVTKHFYSNNAPIVSHGEPASQSHSISATAFWNITGEPVLTRLGFALVELALRKRLSEFRDQDFTDVEDEALLDMLDLTTAKELMESYKVRDEAGQRYHDAVMACLTNQVLVGSKFQCLTSKDVDFQVDVEKYIVGPIRDNFTNTWGQVAVA